MVQLTRARTCRHLLTHADTGADCFPARTSFHQIQENPAFEDDSEDEDPTTPSSRGPCSSRSGSSAGSAHASPRAAATAAWTHHVPGAQTGNGGAVSGRLGGGRQGPEHDGGNSDSSSTTDEADSPHTAALNRIVHATPGQRKRLQGQLGMLGGQGDGPAVHGHGDDGAGEDDTGGDLQVRRAVDVPGSACHSVLYALSEREAIVSRVREPPGTCENVCLNARAMPAPARPVSEAGVAASPRPAEQRCALFLLSRPSRRAAPSSIPPSRPVPAQSLVRELQLAEEQLQRANAAAVAMADSLPTPLAPCPASTLHATPTPSSLPFPSPATATSTFPSHSPAPSTFTPSASLLPGPHAGPTTTPLSTATTAAGARVAALAAAAAVPTQLASAAVGKALACVVKLSRENQGLARVNGQLRGELEAATAAHRELQSQHKLLQAVMAEVGARRRAITDRVRLAL